MNSIVTRPIAFPLLVTLGLMVFLLPLATFHLGEMGLWIVAAAGMVVMAVVLITTLVQRCLPDLGADPLKQLALVGGLRMGLSLAAVLAVCVAGRSFSQPAVLLYAVPFYLGLLVAETIVMVSQIRTTFRGATPLAHR
ncbi:MAG: hypothetical protein WD851_17565 [Pirellulales bacterium]